MTSIDQQPRGIEKFRKTADKLMRRAMVSRIKDRLAQLESDRHSFRQHLGHAKKHGGKSKKGSPSRGRVVSFGVTSSSGYGSDTDKSNVKEECVSSISDDQLDETMTQGNLNMRLNSLNNYGLYSHVEDRVQSALGLGKKPGSHLEREKTFPGQKPRTRKTTALINWATNMSSRSNTRGSDEGSLDSNPALNFLMKRYAMPEDDVIRQVKSRAREKPNTPSLSLDRLARIATLRQNVRFIEGKFRSLLNKQTGPGDSREELKSSASGTAPEDYWPSRFTKEGDALTFFRRRARMIIMVMRWINMVMDMNKNSTWERQLKTFVDLAMDMGDSCDTGTTQQTGDSPAFDKNAFKANKEISLSMDVKTILSTRPEARTPEMIKQVMIGLQTLQSLGEYPLDTQEQLCRVAWFQQVPARKYIIRQGHKPEAFYFILSGLAVVKKIEMDQASGEEQTRVVARLSRGQSFGELGLIFKTPRNATVESGTIMELLVVGKEDFLKIFMHNVKPGEDPDHITFLKQQPVLKHWPFEVLKEDPSACLINYFKRGNIVTESGKASEWIYFVKTGSCVALKRLKSVTPRTGKQLRKLQGTRKKDFQLPEITKSASRPQAIHPELLRSMTEYYDTVRMATAEEHRKSKRHHSSLSHISKESPRSPRVQIPEIIEPTSATPKRQAYLRRTPSTADMTPYPLPPIPAPSPNGSGCSKSKFSGLSKSIGIDALTVPTTSSLSRTFTELDLNKNEVPDTDRDDREDVFVTVEKLQARDIFGMNTVSFSDDDDEFIDKIPEVALVSNGAEIVMLSKRMFLKHADERVKLMVQELITPYPGETQLQENLQIQADWNVYRQEVLSDIMYVNHALRRSMSGVV